MDTAYFRYPMENKHLYDSTINNNQYIECSTLMSGIDLPRYHSTPHPPPSISTTTLSKNNWIPETANLLPTPILEIDPRSLNFIRSMGTAKFGQVNLYQMDAHRLVIVKHLRENASPQLASEFRLEIGMLGRLRHQNILRVIGVSKALNSTGSLISKLCYVVEYMPNGDLRKFLRRESIRYFKIIKFDIFKLP